MSILVDSSTKLVVSGITGREGTFHSLRNRDYGTSVVGGVTPGKGGQNVEGVPVFNTFHDAVGSTGANTAMIFVPPRFAADSILEAEDAGISLIIAITEGIPAHDELRAYNVIKKNGRARLIGPNCPGILSPGKANVGIIPAAFFKEGTDGVPHVVVDPRRIGEVELLTIAEHPLELDKAGDQLRFDIDRSEASGTDEAGGRGADPLDRLRTKRSLLDVNARAQIFRHHRSP